MKILQKPYSVAIWIQNGRLVLPRVGNLCKWTCDCESQHIMSVPMQMKTEEKVCFVCLCVYSQECLPLCLCLWGSHTSHESQSCHNTHRQVWGLGRVWAQILERGLIEQILHSPSCHFLSLALSLSYWMSLSLSCSLCILSFPLCQAQRASLLFRVGNATGAKSAPLSVWYHPSFVLAGSHHHAFGLRQHQSDTWEQVELRQR